MFSTLSGFMQKLSLTEADMHQQAHNGGGGYGDLSPQHSERQLYGHPSDSMRSTPTSATSHTSHDNRYSRTKRLSITIDNTPATSAQGGLTSPPSTQAGLTPQHQRTLGNGPLNCTSPQYEYGYLCSNNVVTIETAVPGCQLCLKQAFATLASDGMPMDQANLAKISELTEAAKRFCAQPCDNHMRSACNDALVTIRQFADDQTLWYKIDGVEGVSFKPLTDVIRKFPNSADVQNASWELFSSVDFADLLCQNERSYLLRPPEVSRIFTSLIRETRELPKIQIAAWNSLAHKFQRMLRGAEIDTSNPWFQGEGLLVAGVLQIARMVVETHSSAAKKDSPDAAHVLDAVFSFMQVFVARISRVSFAANAKLAAQITQAPVLKGMVSHRRWWTRRFVSWLQSSDPQQVIAGTKVLVNGPVLPWLDTSMPDALEFMTREIGELRDVLCQVFYTWSDSDMKSQPNTPFGMALAKNAQYANNLMGPAAEKGYLHADIRLESEAPLPDLLRVFRNMTACPATRDVLLQNPLCTHPISWSIYRFHAGYIQYMKECEHSCGINFKAIKHLLLAHVTAFSFCMELGAWDVNTAHAVLSYLDTAQARLGVWIMQFSSLRVVDIQRWFPNTRMAPPDVISRAVSNYRQAWRSTDVGRLSPMLQQNPEPFFCGKH